jgi:L-alanine-DL-glutamate epimerase-like enolase superfamily enzyme
MKITEAETFLLNIPVNRVNDSQYTVDSINLLVLKISTDAGIDGYGYNWHTADGLDIVKKMFDEYVSIRLIGMDPLMRMNVEKSLMETHNFGWDPRLGYNGIGVYITSLVDIALWDIMCKVNDMPLYRVLGAGSEQVEAYNTDGGWLSWSKEDLVKNAVRLKNSGYKSIKLKVGSRNPMDDYERVESVREAIGYDMKLMIDANTKWDLETAIYMSGKLEKFDIYWLEEPLNPDDIAGHAELRKRTTIPIALGESITNLYSFRDYIVSRAVDIVQVDVTKVGGITEWLKIANLSEAFGLNVYPHTNIQQPLHGQLVASVSNGKMVEHVEWLTDVWRYPVRPEKGYFHLNSIRGAGSEVTEKAIEKFLVT